MLAATPAPIVTAPGTGVGVGDWATMGDAVTMTSTAALVIGPPWDDRRSILITGSLRQDRRRSSWAASYPM